MNGAPNTRFVLVTGATGGMGAHVCRKLAAKGYVPIVGYHHNYNVANDLAKETAGMALPLAMEDKVSIDKAIAVMAKLEGVLAGLVHCASPAPKLAMFSRISEEEMHVFWQTNVVGSQRLLAGLVKECFKREKKGMIVAITSRGMGEALTDAMPGLGAYTVSKFGLYGVLALLASEYKWLTVKAIKPGFTRTAMLGAFDPRFVEQLEAKGEVADPDTVAEEIVSYF